MNEEVLIDGIASADDETLDNLIQGIENEEPIQIEGFFSFIKKAARKVASVGKIANKFGLLPPGAGFGLDVLNKLAASPKTRRRVKFTPAATANVYRVAYLKGYAKALRQVERYARSKRR